MSRHIKYSYQFVIDNRKKNFQAIHHDGDGYMYWQNIFPVEDDELLMTGGRFALWSETPCQYEVSPKLPVVTFDKAGMILQFIRSTVEWNAENCEGKWHIIIEERVESTNNDDIFFVSFDSQRDADEYLVCFALNGGHYERQHEV